ncbi:MAG: MFS transporter [Chloroflexi bacterium]|nr:MFS transporter [Chloroflexota bacterium]
MERDRPLTSYGRWVLAAAILGSGMVFLDSTIVTVALPRIGTDLPSFRFGVLEGQSYVYSGYLLTLSALLILAGAANDHYGRKRMFQTGIVAFAATSLLCGLAPNMEALVLFRVLQGAAGALLVPSSLSLITACFEGEERGRAFGYWSGASSATTILGPVVGGLLVDSVSWRAAFLVNVPVALAALYATRPILESRDTKSAGHLDWPGSAITGLAVGGLAFGAIYGQQREWRDPVAFAALGIGTLATILLPFWMARAKHPLVPLELFRSRNFAVTNISTFLIYGSLYVTFYFLTLFIQGVLGYSAAAAGVAGLPATVLLVLFSSRTGALSARFGPRIFMVVGPLLMAAGVLTFTLIPADAAAWRLGQGELLPPLDYVTWILPGLLVFGAGITLLVTPLVTALMGSVPVRNSGLASAINNAISRVGPQLAGAVLFVAITAVFYAGLQQRTGLDTSRPEIRAAYAPLNPPRDGGDDRASREASTDAFHLAMFVGAVLLAAGAAVNLAIRNTPAPLSAGEVAAAAE